MIAQLSDNEHIIDDIYNFIKHRYSQADENVVKNIIWGHWFYGTIDVIYQGENLVACVRWNVSNDRKVFDILDLFISKGEKGPLVIKHFVARNWHRFPTVRYIRFARILKYPTRGWRVYKISTLLHVKEN